MTSVNWRRVAKGVGMLGAVLTGVSICLSGDFVTGGGVIFAAFSSAPAVAQP